MSEGKAVIQGQLIFRLLYVADNPGKTVSSLEGKLSIEETLHLDKVQSGDKVCLKWEIEDLTIHLINSRKLNVKAIVEFLAVVDEEKQISIPVELKGEEEISAKKKTIRVLTLAVHKKRHSAKERGNYDCFEQAEYSPDSVEGYSGTGA